MGFLGRLTSDLKGPDADNKVSCYADVVEVVISLDEEMGSSSNDDSSTVDFVTVADVIGKKIGQKAGRAYMQKASLSCPNLFSEPDPSGMTTELQNVLTTRIEFYTKRNIDITGKHEQDFTFSDLF